MGPEPPLGPDPQPGTRRHHGLLPAGAQRWTHRSASVTTTRGVNAQSGRALRSRAVTRELPTGPCPNKGMLCTLCETSVTVRGRSSSPMTDKPGGVPPSLARTTEHLAQLLVIIAGLGDTVNHERFD